MEEKMKQPQMYSLMMDDHRGFLDRLLYFLRDYPNYDIELKDITKAMKAHKAHSKNIREGINKLANLIAAGSTDMEMIDTSRPKYIRAKELAIALNVSKSAVSQWSDKGMLREIRNGSAVEFEYRDVDNFVEVYHPKYKSAWIRYKELDT